ncbi:MAG: 16S rRNA (cytosine(1402)-N(4))-methyltransferase, partial [Actinomycetota bacterium]
MADEVTGLLGGRGTVVDMTLGAGGHAEALLDSGVGRVVGIDRDPQAMELAGRRLARFGERFVGVRTRFSNVSLETQVDGFLFDLGVSSMQLERPERGFSYRLNGPLDMRMEAAGDSAKDLVNSSSERDLARILLEYGEEHRARRVASAIARARARRPIETTEELTRVVAGAV